MKLKKEKNLAYGNWCFYLIADCESRAVVKYHLLHFQQTRHQVLLDKDFNLFRRITACHFGSEDGHKLCLQQEAILYLLVSIEFIL